MNIEEKNHSPKSLAADWNCSADEIYKLIRERKLGCFRIGALIRISPEDVRKYKEEYSQCPENKQVPQGQYSSGEESPEYGKSFGQIRTPEQLKSFLRAQRTSAQLSSR